MKPVVAVPLALLSTVGCAADGSARLPVTAACLISDQHRVPVSIELARTASERSKGLMDRTTLAGNAGMLFIYESQQRADHGFWMYRTRIPLDIAYLSEDGVIGAVQQMAPCLSDRGRDCPSYPAGVPFSLALEMNQGFFEKHDIDVGDRLSMDTADCSSS